jgi:hypothetical protein
LVGDERKVQLQRVRECFVLLDPLEAYAEDLGARGGDVGLPVPEGARFLRSTGSEVLRVEVKDVGPPA